MTPEALNDLLCSWLLHLRAEHKSGSTINTYGAGVRAFLRWAKHTGTEPKLDRPTVNAFIADLLEGGAEPATALSRQAAVRRFSKWLHAEGEINADLIATLKPPKLDTKVIPELTEDQLKALIKACAGKRLSDRRDEAIVRLMAETTARAGEVLGMRTTDVDLGSGTAVVRRGKGGKGRRVWFGPQTGRALDRYLRLRRSHRLADTPTLWLGERGRGLSYSGLYVTLRRRAKAAGIPEFHPHVLRHTGAGRWLAAGGSEGGLMAVAGWSSRDMIDRYTRATNERRAADEARRLNLGDL